MPTLVIITYAITVIVLLFSSIFYVAWAIFLKMPKQYKQINVFKLSQQSFLDNVPEGDRTNLKHVRKSLLLLLFSFLFLAVFSILMKVLSLDLLQ